MGFYVPWVIDGSKHSARLFRRTYQQQAGEGSGVTRPADLRVQPLNTPGTGFRVGAGGATVQSRDTDASSRESYGPVNDAEIVVSGVPGTGSGETRRDLVILEITDPSMESVTYPAPVDSDGWQDGDNFCRVTVIQNVDALVDVSERPVRSLAQITSGDYAHVSGIALAAIVWPASTGTITEDMVEDLRVVHAPLPTNRANPFFTYDVPDTQILTETGTYPVGQSFPNRVYEIDQIPPDATGAHVRMDLGSVVIPSGSTAAGGFWGELHGPDSQVVRVPRGAFDADSKAESYRENWMKGADIKIPAGMRGKPATFVFKANLTTAPGDGSKLPRLTTSSSAILDIRFFRAAD